MAMAGLADHDPDDAALFNDEFSAAEYVNDYLRSAKPGDELKRLYSLRQDLKQREADAAETIKNTVFDHYKHFIDTSREVSNLEREIYQLSTMLTDQKKLIDSLQEINGHVRRGGGGGSSSSAASIDGGGSIRSGASSSQQQHNQLQLQTLMSKMDGVAGVVSTLSEHERLITQGQMTLLSADTMAPQHPVLLVLLSSTLLIGHPSSTPGHRQPFQLVSHHSLDGLAIVNVKGAPGFAGAHGSTSMSSSSSLPSADPQSTEQHLLQLLIFPNQLYVRCESARQKRDWLDAVEQAKLRQQQEKSLVRQETIRAKRRSILSSIAAKQPSQLRRGSSREGVLVEETPPPVTKAVSVEDTQWLNELIDELQDEISHRHLEQAVEMLLEWKSCNCTDVVINGKFQMLERTVVQMLSDEVRRVGSLHAGVNKATSQPLALLASLGRATYAVDLYLKRRSASLRHSARDLIITEEPLSYVRQVSQLFVGEILEVVAEFRQRKPTDYCMVLQWCSSEMSFLLSLVAGHVIELAPTIAILAHTWRILNAHCDQLVLAGVDLSFEVNRLLLPSLTAALETNFANIVDALRLRIGEEKWRPYELDCEASLNRYVGEMADLGLAIDWAVSSQSARCLNLAQSALQFARVAHSLSRDFALLNANCHSHLRTVSDSCVRTIWCEYLFHLITAPVSDVHAFTCRFIVSELIPVCDSIYRREGQPADGEEGDGDSKGLVHELLPEKFPALLRYQVVKSGTTSFDEEIANV